MIPITEDSLYINGSVLIFPEGEETLEMGKFVYEPSSRDRYLTLMDGASLMEIAYEYYGNSKYWHIIARANNIEDPIDLPVNKTIVIPDFLSYKSSNL